jgi:hypothetical protein
MNKHTGVRRFNVGRKYTGEAMKKSHNVQLNETVKVELITIVL